MFLILIFTVALSLVSSQQVQLPKSIKTCKKESSDYSSCLRLALQESWPVLVRGMPELEIPPLDPYKTDYMENNFEMGDVTGRIIVKNANSYGLSKTKFLSIRPNHAGDRYSMEVDIEIPKVFIEGEFKSEGKIGQFVIGGKGQFNISMESVMGTVQLDGPVINDRWVVENFNFMPEVKKMKVWASDLFNGNADLTKAALAFVNEYWHTLYKGMLPYAAKTWNRTTRDVLNRIFAKISFSQTFP